MPLVDRCVPHSPGHCKNWAILQWGHYRPVWAHNHIFSSRSRRKAHTYFQLTCSPKSVHSIITDSDLKGGKKRGTTMYQFSKKGGRRTYSFFPVAGSHNICLTVVANFETGYRQWSTIVSPVEERVRHIVFGLFRCNSNIHSILCIYLHVTLDASCFRELSQPLISLHLTLRLMCLAEQISELWEATLWGKTEMQIT